MTSEYYRLSVDGFLRQPPKGYARSAYAIEVNPWTTRGDVEAALLYRGTIVSALGDIEHKLGELSIRASYVPEYRAMRERFPFRIEKRLIFLREAFSRGPLKPYNQLATTLFDKIEKDLEFRNVVAHARMQVLPENYVSFEDIPEARDLEISFRRTPMTLKELERRAWKAALRSRACQLLLTQFDRLNLLPPLEK